MTIPAGITSILLQRDNGLLAIVCDDLAVRIVDIETRRLVRELRGFKGRILDIVSGSFHSSLFIFRGRLMLLGCRHRTFHRILDGS